MPTASVMTSMASWIRLKAWVGSIAQAVGTTLSSLPPQISGPVPQRTGWKRLGAGPGGGRDSVMRNEGESWLSRSDGGVRVSLRLFGQTAMSAWAGRSVDGGVGLT